KLFALLHSRQDATPHPPTPNKLIIPSQTTNSFFLYLPLPTWPCIYSMCIQICMHISMHEHNCAKYLNLHFHTHTLTYIAQLKLVKSLNRARRGKEERDQRKYRENPGRTKRDRERKSMSSSTPRTG
uniref:Uncharacterized protein n=1 Tax=Lates calcarifer TaxID=8187 RepID=A0A4W6FVL9_LATCA